jgi:hypothetical protein
MTTLRHIICLPTFGSPYLIASVQSKMAGDYLKATQKAVDGKIEPYDRKLVILHPMFCENNRRWDMARQMLTHKQTKVWVNDDGANTCSPNMATIIGNPSMRIGGCPHLFGDVCLDVSDTFFKTLNYTPQMFKLVPVPREEGESDDEDSQELSWEPYDDADLKAKIAECEAKGWDFNQSNGFIYEAKITA